uniref:Uncharacterized protein n=1 Tax=Lepeophtheirus salmonis TaxID=72036 RepID=A0A0K2U2C6_LEPSM
MNDESLMKNLTFCFKFNLFHDVPQTIFFGPHISFWIDSFIKKAAVLRFQSKNEYLIPFKHHHLSHFWQCICILKQDFQTSKLFIVMSPT